MKQQLDTSRHLRTALKVPVGALSARQYNAARSDNMAADGKSPYHVLAQDMADVLGLVPDDYFNTSPLCNEYDGNGVPPLGSGGYDWKQADYDAVFRNYDSGCDVFTGTDSAMPNDWEGPYLVRGRNGCGERESCAAVFVGTHSVDCVDGEILAYSLWLAVPDCEILLSDARGQFIPRDFALHCVCVSLTDPPDGGLCGLEPNDDGSGMLEWIPGTYTHDDHGQFHGLACDFYGDDAGVDTRWHFDEAVLRDLATLLNPDDEWYWEAWQNIEQRCRARLQVLGTLCDGTADTAQYDAILEQNSDLFVVFRPRLR